MTIEDALDDPQAPAAAEARAAAAAREERLYEEARRTGLSPLSVRFLQVETSSECNFRCPSCALALPDYDRPERHMTPEQFARVLDAFPTVERVEMQGVGEVFLNRDLFELIREATDRGVKVHSFSNASRIDRETARRVVESGVELLNFSMDGADEPTFKRLRKGGTLKRYRRCVANLVEARAALRSRTPTIGVMTVLSKANVRQVPRMIAIAEELGVDAIVFTKLNDAPKPDQRPLVLGRSDREWLDSLPPHRGRVEVHWAYRPWTKGERQRCYWPREMTYVTVDGDVTPCCNHFDSRDVSLGNVFEQSGEEIWNGERYRAFRKRLLSGDLPEKCRKC